MVTFCKLNYTVAYTSILTYFNLTYPVTVFGSRFHKVRLSMMVLNPLVLHLHRAQLKPLQPLIHIFLPCFPQSAWWTTTRNLDQPNPSQSVHSSLCPNHPNLLLRRASSNIPTPHLLATSSLDTQSHLVTRHIPEHPSVTPNQHTLKSLHQGPHLSPIQHHRSNVSIKHH